LCKNIFGGTLEEGSKSQLQIKNTQLGDFKIEVDAQAVQKLSQASKHNLENNKKDLEGLVSEVVAPITKAFVPNEIVTPPLLISQIEGLYKLEKELIKAGAQGTHKAIQYAFGLHINPQAPSFKAESILAYLRAFVLLQDWLAKEISIDITRRIRHLFATLVKQDKKQ
jgi:hypothetical protein